MQDSLFSRGRLWLLLAAFAVVWFATLDYRRLIKPDEGRYAEIAREMAVSGDWVTPRLNGIKYFEKPPLQYWATAAAFKVFGENEWTARLWPALTGFGGVLLAFFAGRRLFGERAGLFSAGILASSLFYLAIGHMNTLDMGLCFFLHLAIAGFLLAQHPGATVPQQRNWMLLTWAALALAVLSKGLVALVLTGASLVAYTALTRDTGPWRRLALLPGLALFLALVTPWFLAVSAANPEFARFFFIHEHFERFLTTTHRRTQPWWYFLPVLAVAVMPWTTVVARGLAAGWERNVETAFQARRFLVVWTLLVFAFFSLSSSKLPSYILPILPALAWLGAITLSRSDRRELSLHASIVTGLAAIALVLVPLVSRLGDAETPRWMMSGYAVWLAVATALWLAASATGLWLARRGHQCAAVLWLAGGGFAAGNGIALGHETLSPSNSAYAIAQIVRPLLAPSVPFYSVRMYEQTLPFYLQRTVTLVEYTDEMGFGLQQEPDKWVPTMSEFASRWHSDTDAFAVMAPKTYQNLNEQGLPMRIVAQDTRRVIVRKP